MLHQNCRKWMHRHAPPVPKDSNQDLEGIIRTTYARSPSNNSKKVESSDKNSMRRAKSKIVVDKNMDINIIQMDKKQHEKRNNSKSPKKINPPNQFKKLKTINLDKNFQIQPWDETDPLVATQNLTNAKSKNEKQNSIQLCHIGFESSQLNVDPSVKSKANKLSVMGHQIKLHESQSSNQKICNSQKDIMDYDQAMNADENNKEHTNTTLQIGHQTFQNNESLVNSGPINVQSQVDAQDIFFSTMTGQKVTPLFDNQNTQMASLTPKQSSYMVKQNSQCYTNQRQMSQESHDRLSMNMFKGRPIYQQSGSIARRYGKMVQKQIILNNHNQIKGKQQLNIMNQNNLNQLSNTGIDSPKQSIISLGHQGMFIQELSNESSVLQKDEVISRLKQLNEQRVLTPNNQMVIKDFMTPNLSQTEKNTLRTSGTPGDTEFKQIRQQIKNMTFMASPIPTGHHSPNLTPIEQLAEGESSQEGSPKKYIKHKSQLMKFNMRKFDQQNNNVLAEGLQGTSFSTKLGQNIKQITNIKTPDGRNVIGNAKSVNQSNHNANQQNTISNANDSCLTGAIKSNQYGTSGDDSHSSPQSHRMKAFQMPTSRVTLITKQSQNRSNLETPNIGNDSIHQTIQTIQNQQQPKVDQVDASANTESIIITGFGNVNAGSIEECHQISEETPLMPSEVRMMQRFQKNEQVASNSIKTKISIIERLYNKKPKTQQIKNRRDISQVVNIKLNFAKSNLPSPVKPIAQRNNSILNQNNFWYMKQSYRSYKSNNSTRRGKNGQPSEKKFMVNHVTWNENGTYEFYTQSHFDEQQKVKEEKERNNLEKQNASSSVPQTTRRGLRSNSNYMNNEIRDHELDEQTLRVFQLPESNPTSRDTQNYKAFDNMNDLVIDKNKERLFGSIQNTSRRGPFNQTHQQQSTQYSDFKNRTLSNRGPMLSPLAVQTKLIGNQFGIKQQNHVGIMSDNTSTISENRVQSNLADLSNMDGLSNTFLQASNPILQSKKAAFLSLKVLKNLSHATVTQVDQPLRNHKISKHTNEVDQEIINNNRKANFRNRQIYPNYTAFFPSKHRTGQYPLGGAGSMTKRQSTFINKFDQKKRLQFNQQFFDTRLLITNNQNQIDLNDQNFFNKIESKMNQNELDKVQNSDLIDDDQIATPTLQGHDDTLLGTPQEIDSRPNDTDIRSNEDVSEQIESGQVSPRPKSRNLKFKKQQQMDSHKGIDDWLERQQVADCDVRSTLKAHSPFNDQETSMNVHPSIVNVQKMQSNTQDDSKEIYEKFDEVIQRKNTQSNSNQQRHTFHRIYMQNKNSPIKVDIQVSDYMGKQSSKRSEGSASRTNQDPYPIKILQPKLQNQFSKFTFLQDDQFKNKSKQGFYSPEINKSILNGQKKINKQQQPLTPQVRVVFSSQNLTIEDQKKVKAQNDLKSEEFQTNTDKSVQKCDQAIQNETMDDLQIQSGQNILRATNESNENSLIDSVEENPKILDNQIEQSDFNTSILGRSDIDQQIETMIKQQNMKAHIKRQALNQKRSLTKRSPVQNISNQQKGSVSISKQERLHSNLLMQKYFGNLPLNQFKTPRDFPMTVNNHTLATITSKSKRQYPPTTRENKIHLNFQRIKTKVDSFHIMKQKEKIHKTLDEEERLIEYQKSIMKEKEKEKEMEKVLELDYEIEKEATLEHPTTQRLNNDNDLQDPDIEINIIKENIPPMDFFEDQQMKITSRSRTKYLSNEQTNLHTLLNQQDGIPHNSNFSNNSVNKSSNQNLSFFKLKDQDLLKSTLPDIDSIIKGK